MFASVGAGATYLAAGSPYRAAGTEAIAATLLAELRAWGTTREPAVQTGAITADTVWEPLVERSAGLPENRDVRCRRWSDRAPFLVTVPMGTGLDFR